MRTFKSVSKVIAIVVVVFFTVSAVQAQTYTDTDLKKNIQPISEPLKTIKMLEPKAFEYNTSKYDHLKLPSGVHYGFIAEDVERVFPGSVTYSKVSYMKGKNLFRSASVPSVNMDRLVPVLIASVREQQAAIEQLRAEIVELKRQLGTAR